MHMTVIVTLESCKSEFIYSAVVSVTADILPECNQPCNKLF